MQRVEKGSSEGIHRPRPFQPPNHQLNAQNEGLYEMYGLLHIILYVL